MISNIDATTCNLSAVVAVTFNISLSCKINGSVNNCSVALVPILLLLNKLNTAAAASVNVTLILSPLPESSLTNRDFTIALELDGTVYKVVAAVVVKSNF